MIFDGGCNFEQQDEDGDGVSNGDDACPYTSPGAVLIDGGCSRQQLAPADDGGMSTGTLIAIIAAVFTLILGGAIVAITVIKRKQDVDLEARRAVKRGDMPAPATEVAEEALDEADEYNYEDDPNYKVDENGCEWWYDEGVWWFRTPEMEDWAELDDE